MQYYGFGSRYEAIVSLGRPLTAHGHYDSKPIKTTPHTTQLQAEDIVCLQEQLVAMNTSVYRTSF